MKVEQFVMAYGVEQDRLRALLPDGFSSLRPVLRINAAIRDEKTGYAVRPSERNRGLATQILRQGLSLAAQFGFDGVLCVCDADNAASETVILKNGGVLEDERYDPEEAVAVRRYWIDLPK